MLWSDEKNGLGYDVVMNLIQPLKSKFHALYFDRFFSSIKLVHDLLKKDSYACGTILNIFGMGVSYMHCQRSSLPAGHVVCALGEIELCGRELQICISD